MATHAQTAEMTREILSRHFSVEIELCLPLAVQRESIRAAIPYGWDTASDSSIEPREGERGWEIRAPFLIGPEGFETLRQGLAALTDLGGVSDAARVCGIHVHVDARDLRGEALANIANDVLSNEDMLRMALAIAPSRANYCKPADRDALAAVAVAATEDSTALAACGAVRSAWDGSTRYTGVNLNPLFTQGSVEFRYFNGTLHPTRVTAYATLALAMVARAIHGPKARRMSTGEVWNATHSRELLRSWMGNHGLVGPSHAATRAVLLQYLPHPPRDVVVVVAGAMEPRGVDW